MNFTDQPPIKPGFYAWKFHESHRERAREVLNNGGGNLICDDTRRNVKDVGGLWCHLLPASERDELKRTVDFLQRHNDATVDDSQLIAMARERDQLKQVLEFIYTNWYSLEDPPLMLKEIVNHSKSPTQ